MSRQSGTQSLARSALIVVVLCAGAVGCDASPARTPSPSQTPGVSPAPSSIPTARPTVTAQPSTAPSPSPTPSPAPTPQAPVADRWVYAGSTSRDFGYGAQLVALPNGGAVLLGSPVDDEGTHEANLAVERWDPEIGWRPGASTDGRERFAAVALPDGRVLVAGGANESEQSLKDTMVYDPVADTWTEVGSLDHARTHAAMVLLPDGHVLIVGGFRWEQGGDMGSIGANAAHVPEQPASLRAGALLPDVILTPRGPALATAELFDPATGTWSSTGPMRFARTGPAIAVLAGGRVLVAGADGPAIGTGEPTRIDSRAFTTTEIYDPTSGRFSAAGTLAEFDREALARNGVELPDWPPEPGPVGTLVPLRDGGAVLVGREASWKHTGEVVWSARLAPDLNSWRAIGEPFGQLDTHDPEGESSVQTGVSRLGAVIVGLPDGSVLVAGGSPGYSSVGRAPVSVTRYHPGRDTWTDERDLPEARFWPLGVALTDGTLLVVGGDHRDGDWAADAYRFSPTLRR